MSCLTLSTHLYLGLPCDLLVRGFHLNIFLTVLVSGILCMWPNQLSLWALIWLIIFLCFTSLSNSSLVLILHIWFSFIGPNIFLKIFLSKTSNFWIMVSFSTHVGRYKPHHKQLWTAQFRLRHKFLLLTRCREEFNHVTGATSHWKSKQQPANGDKTARLCHYSPHKQTPSGWHHRLYTPTTELSGLQLHHARVWLVRSRNPKNTRGRIICKVDIDTIY